MGIKRTSEILTIGFEINESALNTFTQERIDLQLNPLDLEVLLIYAVDLDPGRPSCIPGTNTQTTMSMTSTSQSAVPTIGEANCFARTQYAIQSTTPDAAVGFQHVAPDTPTGGDLPYIAIVATSDMFVQIKGANNSGAVTGSGKVFCARARVDASVYAALVQSQVLSS